MTNFDMFNNELKTEVFVLPMSETGIKMLPFEMQNDIRTETNKDCYIGYIVNAELYVNIDNFIINKEYVLRFMCSMYCTDGCEEGIEITNTMTVKEESKLVKEIIEKSYRNVTLIISNYNQ